MKLHRVFLLLCKKKLFFFYNNKLTWHAIVLSCVFIVNNISPDFLPTLTLNYIMFSHVHSVFGVQKDAVTTANSNKKSLQKFTRSIGLCYANN